MRPTPSLVSLWKTAFIHNSFLLNTLHVIEFTSLLSFFVVSTEKKAMFEAINEYVFQILSIVSSSPLFNSKMKYLGIQKLQFPSVHRQHIVKSY